jgi:two-component system sensor histidine kinase QseC
MIPSVRRRLLLTLLSAAVVVWTVTAAVIYHDVHREVNDLFDANLANTAQLLLSLVGHEMEEDLKNYSGANGQRRLITKLDESFSSNRYNKKVAFQVWIGGKGPVFRSARAPETPLSSVTSGFSDEKIAGHNWRVVTIASKSGLVRVNVAERSEIRRELIEDIAQPLLVPFILGLPLLALLIWLSVGRSLRPFRRLARQIASREPSNLQPLVQNPVPIEAKPLVDALNALFERLQQAIDREKRLTTDAAHELRTPLAGLRTQAEVAQRAVDEREKRNALQQLIHGVDRTTRLVEQLLTMARLDPEVKLHDLVPVDMHEIAGEVLAEMTADATGKKIDLSLEGQTGTAVISGDGASLQMLVRNLVNNAIRYTPAGGHVVVSVTSSHDQVVLKVSDSGPGIAAEERERVFERFYRGQDSSGTGSGLGLSIAQRIAALHRACIILATSVYGGLEVQVVFHRETVS